MLQDGEQLLLAAANAVQVSSGFEASQLFVVCVIYRYVYQNWMSECSYAVVV